MIGYRQGAIPNKRKAVGRQHCGRDGEANWERDKSKRTVNYDQGKNALLPHCITILRNVSYFSFNGSNYPSSYDKD
jgi:hypothetical protein